MPGRKSFAVTSRDSTSFLTLAGGNRRSWRDRLAVAAFLPATVPFLARSLRGGSKAAKRLLLDRLGLPDDALPHLGSWKADTGLLHRLVDIVERDRPQTVVELGIGASSLILSRALKRHGGGRLVGLDQHEDFVAATRAWLAEHGVEADLRHAPLEDSRPYGWPGAFYRLDDIPESIDLAVIDGPPWTLHPLTRGAAERLFDRVSVGGTVILDDGARPGERLIRRRWARDWPDFDWRLEGGGTKGTVVGMRTA